MGRLLSSRPNGTKDRFLANLCHWFLESCRCAAHPHLVPTVLAQAVLPPSPNAGISSIILRQQSVKPALVNFVNSIIYRMSQVMARTFLPFIPNVTWGALLFTQAGFIQSTGTLCRYRRIRLKSRSFYLHQRLVSTLTYLHQACGSTALEGKSYGHIGKSQSGPGN